MFSIRRYAASERAAWDGFVAQAKNGLFLFRRDYMEYHADRFADHSLCILRDGDLFALLPACERDGELLSHAGLTFGGVLCDERMKTTHMLEIAGVLGDYLSGHRFRSLTYKAVPYIYASGPAQEDSYALFRMGAAVEKREVSSAICRRHPCAYSERRARGVRRAGKHSLQFVRSQDYAPFFALLGGILDEKYHARPTHTSGEMELLAGRFPDNIALWEAHGADGRLLAGVVVYLHAHVAHAQYIAASEEGKACAALDGLFDHLISRVYPGHDYFDFGISTEDAGRRLNAGLITQKEEFGARAVVQETWVLRLE